MPSSSVPPIQFTNAGLIVPSEADVLAGRQSDINSAFGGALSPALETPQGQLASSETAIIAEKNSQIANFVNQIDPQYADGRFQDALGRLFLLTRRTATKTRVRCVCQGTIGVTVPAGVKVLDDSGYTYTADESFTFSPTGYAYPFFTNDTEGAIPCPINTISTIVNAYAGWDTVANSSGAYLGSPAESRAEFEYRRQKATAVGASGTTAAIYSALYKVDGVADVFIIENATSADITVANEPVAPHHIFIHVQGGDDYEVAKAIASTKGVGCSYGSANTVINVTDESGYAYPPPVYEVAFWRGPSFIFKFEVEINASATYPAEVVSMIKTAIFNRFYGLDGDRKERIGGYIKTSRYFGALLAAVPDLSIIRMRVWHGSTPPAWEDGYQALSPAVYFPYTELSRITVTIV